MGNSQSPVQTIVACNKTKLLKPECFSHFLNLVDWTTFLHSNHDHESCKCFATVQVHLCQDGVETTPMLDLFGNYYNKYPNPPELLPLPVPRPLDLQSTYHTRHVKLQIVMKFSSNLNRKNLYLPPRATCSLSVSQWRVPRSLRLKVADQELEKNTK